MTFFEIIAIIIGAILLLSGRKLYWFFTGAAGFILGLIIVGQFFKDQELWLQIVISLAGGLLGIVLAFTLQKIILSVAGFLAGGYGLVALLSTWKWFAESPFRWLAFIIGGIIGVILILKLFEWGLILLSSFGGAGMILQAINVDGIAGVVVFLVLMFIGVVIQWRTMKSGVKPVPVLPTE